MRACTFLVLVTASLTGCPADVVEDDAAETDAGPADARSFDVPADAPLPDAPLPDAPELDAPAVPDDTAIDARGDDAPIDAPGAITVAIGDLRVTERTAEIVTARLPITFSAPLPSDITLAFSQANGTAILGTDLYVPSGFDLSVLRGATSASFEVVVAGDYLDEPDEDCTVTLYTTIDSTYLSITRATATLTIVDDDEPYFRILPAERALAEGTAAAPGTTMLRVERTGASPWPGSVRVRTVAGTAETSDFVALDRTLSFPADSTVSHDVVITLVGDAVAERDETFRVELLDPVGGLILSAEGGTLVTITNDDPPEISGCLSRSVTEGDTGRIRFDFVLTSNVPAPPGVRALFTIGGTASRSVDYELVGFATMTSGVDFPVGASTAVVSIDVINDTAVEINETVTLTLIGTSGAAGATLSPSCTLSTLTIVEDDPF